MKLDRNSGTPLHIQAENILRKLIESDEYKSGKMLPNEVELSEQLHISRNTLRQAINQLVMEGRLVRKKGVGTKVARKGINGGVKNWLSFTQEMKTMGIKVRNYELHVCFSPTSSDCENFFGIEPGTRCLKLERLRGNQDFPFVFFISYFNPDIKLSADEDFTNPLYDTLEKHYGVVVYTSQEEISARLAGDFIASKLGISPNDPILIRKRYVLDEKGVPIEYNIGYYRADSFTYSIEATR